MNVILSPSCLVLFNTELCKTTGGTAKGRTRTLTRERERERERERD